LSGPIDAGDGEPLRNTRFAPFDKYLADADLDLFDPDFVNELLHKSQPERLVFGMKTDQEGNEKRQFKAQGPRRLKEKLCGNIAALY
jgi:hypothetical protein